MHTSSSTKSTSTPSGDSTKYPRTFCFSDDEDTEEVPDDGTRRVKAELDNATWQLQPKSLARALSAKRYRHPAAGSIKEACASDTYDIELDVFDEAVVDGLSQGATSTVNDYMSFATYFDDLVKSCRSRFVHTYANQYFCITDNHSSPSIDQIDLSVEAYDDLSSLVLQAGLRAVALFQSEPLRNFALVLGYNHEEHAHRFLVFHRSGLTMSPSLKADTFEGRKNIAWLVLSLCTWRTRNDAGMPEWHLDSHLHLPGDATGTLYEKVEVLRLSKSIRSKTPCVWRISPVQATPTVSSSETIKDLPMPSGGHTDASLMEHPAMFLNSPSLQAGIGKFDNDLALKFSCVSGNSIPKEGELLQSCNGKFSIVKHFFSFPVFLASVTPSSSDLLLPQNAIPLFTDDSGDPLNHSRSLWCHVTSYAGESLHCSTCQRVVERPSLRSDR